MLCLIFSDIHGNLPAFEKVLKKEKNIDMYINLGDVVNYGPWNNECVELVNTLNCLNLKGNHEDYFIYGRCNVSNQIVQEFFQMNYVNFNKKKIIENYQEEILFNNFVFRHNIKSKDYIFIDTKVSVKNNLIIGHSHQQYIRDINKFKLINPGSIGQNRKNLNLSNYIIWDLEKNKFFLREMVINNEIMIKELKARKFPKICINYLERKLNEI